MNIVIILTALATSAFLTLWVFTSAPGALMFAVLYWSLMWQGIRWQFNPNLKWFGHE